MKCLLISWNVKLFRCFCLPVCKLRAQSKVGVAFQSRAGRNADCSQMFQAYWTPKANYDGPCEVDFICSSCVRVKMQTSVLVAAHRPECMSLREIWRFSLCIYLLLCVLSQWANLPCCMSGYCVTCPSGEKANTIWSPLLGSRQRFTLQRKSCTNKGRNREEEEKEDSVCVFGVGS